MKRKLKDQELTMAMKMLDIRQGEIEWFDYQILYHNLMLKTGLDMNHKKNVRDFKNKRREHMENLKMAKDVIKILQSQIRDGVDIKEKKKEGEEGEERKEIKQKTGDK